MEDISDLLKNLNLVNYKFDEEENIIFSRNNNAQQIVELVDINKELDENNINYIIDKDCNFLIVET